MKKRWMAVMMIAMVSCLFCGNTRVFIDFNYSLGLSSFFKPTVTSLEIDHVPGIQTSKSYPGFGFKLGADFPVINNLSLMPYASVNFGHKKTDFKPTDTQKSSIFRTEYFHGWIGGLDAVYTYLRLKNGWQLYAQTGVNMNFVSSPSSTVFDKKSYLGWQAGLGFAFRQVKNWGVHALFFYKTLFTSENISFAGIDAGLFYKI